MGSEPADPTTDHARRLALARRAQRALHGIGRDAALENGRQTGPGEAHHLAFVRLYFHTTRLWIDHLKDQADAHIGHMVIDRFYDLYDLYVRRMIDGRSAQTAAHWVRYFQLLGTLRDGGSTARQWELLALAARAHTRYDLAEAMYSAYRDYPVVHGCAPDRAAFRRVLLGQETDAVFLNAALDFLSMPAIRSEDSAMHGDRLLHMGTGWFRRLWVPAFQHWRHAAWADALARIDSGR